MSYNEVIINKKDHPDIYEWLSKNVYNYKEFKKYFTLTSEGKINAYCSVDFRSCLTEFKYPFGCVDGHFSCNSCKNLKSLINSPEKIEKGFYFSGCFILNSFVDLPKYVGENFNCAGNKFSNDPSDKERYKLYLAIWLELLESVSNKDRMEYINNYKDKKEWDTMDFIIPIEILKEYGF